MHQGRNRGGMDCVGLLTCAAEECGINTVASKDVTGYGHIPDHRLFAKKLPLYMEEVPYNRLQPLRKQVKPGDVMVFWIDLVEIPRHVAVYTGINRHGYDMMIHSFAKFPRKVLEMPMDPGFWYQRILSVWTVPGLED